MERREFLVNGGMTAMGLALLGGCAPATTTAPMVPPTMPPPPPLASRSDEALNAIFTRIFEEKMKAQPSFCTVLGIDTGANAALRSTFDPKPARGPAPNNGPRDKAALAAVKGVDPATLSRPLRTSIATSSSTISKRRSCPWSASASTGSEPLSDHQQTGLFP